jgi:hypothetical protein
VRQYVGHLVGHGVGIDRHRNGAERLTGADRPIEPRAIAADDGELVAALETEFGEPDREGANFLENLLPRPSLQTPRSFWRIAGRAPIEAAL